MSSTTIPIGNPDVLPLYTSIVVGRHGESQLLTGWHDREIDGRSGVAYRASGEVAMLELLRQQGTGELRVLLSGPVGLTESRALIGRLTVNGRRHEVPLAVDAWVLRVFPLESHRDRLTIRLELPDAPVPDHVLSNGDARRLGWFLSAIWQQ